MSMAFKQTAIVLSSNQYSFDDKAGKAISGCSIHYVATDSLAPYANEDGSSKGYKPAKSSLPLVAYEGVKEVPGLYQLDIELQVGSDGVMKAKVVGLDFVSALVQPGARV